MEELRSMIQLLRDECNRGFASVNRRLDSVEVNYHQAVETLPLMRGLTQKIDTVLSHMTDGGERAKLLRELRG